jgi:hypothetical protein
MLLEIAAVAVLVGLCLLFVRLARAEAARNRLKTEAEQYEHWVDTQW